MIRVTNNFGSLPWLEFVLGEVGLPKLEGTPNPLAEPLSVLLVHDARADDAKPLAFAALGIPDPIFTQSASLSRVMFVAVGFVEVHFWFLQHTIPISIGYFLL